MRLQQQDVEAPGTMKNNGRIENEYAKVVVRPGLLTWALWKSQLVLHGELFTRNLTLTSYGQFTSSRFEHPRGHLTGSQRNQSSKYMWEEITQSLPDLLQSLQGIVSTF